MFYNKTHFKSGFILHLRFIFEYLINVCKYISTQLAVNTYIYVILFSQHYIRDWICKRVGIL